MTVNDCPATSIVPDRLKEERLELTVNVAVPLLLTTEGELMVIHGMGMAISNAAAVREKPSGEILR